MSGGVPPSSRAKSRAAISDRKDVQKAARLYERFSGHQAESLGKITLPPMPRVGACVGEVDFVGYTTVRDGVQEAYIHKFKSKDKPLLVVSPDGRSLHLIGGSYRFTERGIVDNSDKSG
jgi:hypothetical protein